MQKNNSDLIISGILVPGAGGGRGEEEGGVTASQPVNTPMMATTNKSPEKLHFEWSLFNVVVVGLGLTSVCISIALAVAIFESLGQDFGDWRVYTVAYFMLLTSGLSLAVMIYSVRFVSIDRTKDNSDNNGDNNNNNNNNKSS